MLTLTKSHLATLRPSLTSSPRKRGREEDNIDGNQKLSLGGEDLEMDEADLDEFAVHLRAGMQSAG